MSDPRGPSLFRIMGDLFRGRERWLLFLVFGVSIVAALFETVGVASIMPFMYEPSATPNITTPTK